MKNDCIHFALQYSVLFVMMYLYILKIYIYIYIYIIDNLKATHLNRLDHVSYEMYFIFKITHINSFAKLNSST